MPPETLHWLWELFFFFSKALSSIFAPFVYILDATKYSFLIFCLLSDFAPQNAIFPLSPVQSNQYTLNDSLK